MIVPHQRCASLLQSTAFDETKRGPLRNIRVIDMSRLVAGNMLSLQLADFGADVLKIEAIGTGDPLRDWKDAHSEFPEGFDGWWQVYGRNKRSVALNLRSEAAHKVFLSLVDEAEVLIESFKPGTLEKMGLAPLFLHTRNPRLIIVRVSGWGQTGPYRDLPGFGSLIEGFCGYARKNGHEGQPPLLPNMALADMVAGLTGAFATLAALRELEVGSGQGQVIDLSLLEPMTAIMGPDAANYAGTGIKPDARLKIASPRGVYQCQDGKWVCMSGSTDKMARRIFEIIGKSALFDEARFSTNAARLDNDEAIEDMLQEFIGGYDQASCLELFRNAGITVGPVYDIEELLQDTHVIERGVYVKSQGQNDAGPVVMHNVVPALSATPGSLRLPAPRRGQHTAEVLRAMGLGDQDLEKLSRSGAIECE
ncbi:CaiB/BaiF CoA transferase family protein [Paralcaligenes ginsengisoli]